jgi:hypothetical protein
LKSWDILGRRLLNSKSHLPRKSQEFLFQKHPRISQVNSWDICPGLIWGKFLRFFVQDILRTIPGIPVPKTSQDISGKFPGNNLGIFFGFLGMYQEYFARV